MAFLNHKTGYLMKSKITYTLGINFLHSDSSACIFKNGELIAACEEERFTRIKHTSLFPKESIIFCLDEAKISPIFNQQHKKDVINEQGQYIIQRSDDNLLSRQCVRITSKC